LLGGIVQTAGDALSGANQAGGDATRGLIGDFLQTAEDTARSAAGDAGDISNAAHTASGGLDQVVADMSGLIGDLENAINDLGNSGAATGHGLIGDIVNAADDAANNAAGDARGLLGDVLKTTGDAIDNGLATTHDVAGNVLANVGGVGSGGIDNGHDLLGDVIKTIDDVGNNGIGAAHDLLADLHAVLSGALGGDSSGNGAPLLALDVMRGGNGMSTQLANDATGALGDMASGLGLNGSIADLSVLSHGGSSLGSAAVGENQAALIDVGVLGNGSSPSHNLIDANIGPQSSVPQIVANVLAGPDPGAQSTAEANAINVGPNGQTLLATNVLTAPDQFHFPVLNGSGSDALVGAATGDVTKAVADLHLSGPTSIVDAADHQPLVEVGGALLGDHAFGVQEHPHGLV
jgi:hypothetical protein